MQSIGCRTDDFGCLDVDYLKSGLASDIDSVIGDLGETLKASVSEAVAGAEDLFSAAEKEVESYRPPPGNP
jgi:hypothetical protein